MRDVVQGMWPVMNQRIHYDMTYRISALQRRQEGRISASLLSRQTLPGAHTRRGLVIIAYGSQNQDAVPIHLARVREECKRLQRAGIFHAGDGEMTLTASVVTDPGIRPCVHFCAMPEG